MLPFRHRRLEIKILQYCTPSASLVAQSVKNLPAVQETCVQSLGGKDPLEKEMAMHSTIVAGKISWIVELGGLQTTRLQRARPD